MVEKSKFSFGLNECLILGVRSLTRALKSLEASPGVPSPLDRTLIAETALFLISDSLVNKKNSDSNTDYYFVGGI